MDSSSTTMNKIAIAQTAFEGLYESQYYEQPTRITKDTDGWTSTKRMRSSNNMLPDIASAKRSRKRVRFGEDGESKSVKRQIVERLRPVSEMSCNERRAVWYQKSELKESLRAAQGLARKFGRHSDGQSCYETGYSTLLTGTYTSCLFDSEDSNLSDQCAEQLAVIASAGDCCRQDDCSRGLERITIPEVGNETLKRRRIAIGSVLVAQSTLTGAVATHEQSELLRLISESQTRPARKFAKALGVVDAMSALVEYRAL